MIEILGGFEGSTIRFADGRRYDAIDATNHDRHVAVDYQLLRRQGINRVRDAVRWHLIEYAPGKYVWDSLSPMIEAALEAGVDVIWDLCHFGVPEHIDVMAQDFSNRFADFAGAVATVVKGSDPRSRIWCPINEISYWAHAAGNIGYMAPSARGQAPALKRQLVSAFLAAQTRIKTVDVGARFLATDPLIYVSTSNGETAESQAVTNSGYEAWDMLLGLKEPQLGGHREAIDFCGVNYFGDNQWKLDGNTLSMGTVWYRPLNFLLQDVWKRYGLTLLISETGAEGENAASWFRYVDAEAGAAVRAGVDIDGICVYPIMDYPGWVDGRHCRCGIIRLDTNFDERALHRDLASLISGRGC